MHNSETPDQEYRRVPKRHGDIPRPREEGIGSVGEGVVRLVDGAGEAELLVEVGHPPYVDTVVGWRRVVGHFFLSGCADWHCWLRWLRCRGRCRWCLHCIRCHRFRLCCGERHRLLIVQHRMVERLIVQHLIVQHLIVGPYYRRVMYRWLQRILGCHY